MGQKAFRNLIVVSDSSPILNLTVVGKLHLLRDIFSEIIVPPAVEQELAKKGIRLDSSWMQVVAAQDRNELVTLRGLLDPGEAEAIVVAGELSAALILIDERRGRRIAMDRGLQITGLLGVLARARPLGLIPKCQPILDEMIRRANFWIGDDLRTQYLRDLEEII